MAVPREVNVMEQNNVDCDIAVEYEFSSLLGALAAAAEFGDVVALGTAIDSMHGFTDEPLENNDTALHLACLYGNLPCVELLLERGADMEVKDLYRATPLHNACDGGYLDIVEFLLSRASGPECAKRMIETIDQQGDTPLHNAARGEYVDVVRLLLSSGASPTTKNSSGKTPGDLAGRNSEARRILEVAVGNSSIS
ncbi:unnamed protein product [Brassica oleracea]